MTDTEELVADKLISEIECLRACKRLRDLQDRIVELINKTITDSIRDDQELGRPCHIFMEGIVKILAKTPLK